MFALLLTAAFTAPVTPTEEITFPTGQRMTVTGPTNRSDGQGWSPPWTHEQTLMSPRGNAAAVRFCWDAVKYHGCQVYLARPAQPVMELKNSNVTRLLWTGDGKYLIGAGENTVRLWNLSGGSRASVPRPALASGQQSVSHIGRLWLRDHELCVAMNSEVFGPNGGYAIGYSTTTTRYALPTLKPLTVTTLGVGPNEKAKEAECRPFTSSDLWP